jgi:hypothetical protein
MLSQFTNTLFATNDIGSKYWPLLVLRDHKKQKGTILSDYSLSIGLLAIFFLIPDFQFSYSGLLLICHV